MPLRRGHWLPPAGDAKILPDIIGKIVLKADGQVSFVVVSVGKTLGHPKQYYN